MNEATLKRIPIFTIEPEKGYFAVSGRSYPENVMEVYRPILDAFNEYSENPKENTVFDLKFEFCSTSTSKVLITIFEKLEDMKRGHSNMEININWFCEEEDEDKFELGEDLKECTDLPFNMVMVP